MSKKPEWFATSIFPPLPNTLCMVALHPDAGHYYSVWNGKNWSTFAHLEEAAIAMRHQPFLLKKGHETYYVPVRVLAPLLTATTTRSIMSFNSHLAAARQVSTSDLLAFFGNVSSVFRPSKPSVVKTPQSQPLKAKPSLTRRGAKVPTRSASKSQPVPSAWGPKGEPASTKKPTASRQQKPQLTAWLLCRKTPPVMSGAYEVKMRNADNELHVDVLKWSADKSKFLGVPRGYEARAYRGLTKESFKAQQAFI